MNQLRPISVLKFAANYDIPYKAVQRLLTKGYLYPVQVGKRVYIDLDRLEVSVKEYNDERRIGRESFYEDISIADWVHKMAEWSKD